MHNQEYLNNFVPVLKGFILILVAGLLPLHAAASSEISEASESYESFGVDTLPDVTLKGVTVTAVKQGSDLSKQGIATTSLSRPALEANNMLSAKAVTSAIPNVFIPDYGSRMTSTIYVRGIGARIDQPAVGLTIDNIPILCKENYDFDLLDIARFEMLHGPQSTLFGRNTMGGVMNVFTLSPFNYQGTRILFEGASHMSFKAGLSHYAKLNPQFSLSASAYYTTTHGAYTNEYNGKKCDWEHQGSGRVKLEWMPSPTLFVSNVLSLSVSRQGGYPYRYLDTGKISYNDTCFYRRTAILDGITIVKRLGDISLSSFTSYQYIDDNMTLDQDFTPLPYFTLTQARKEHAVTQDLVLRNTDSKRYNWLAGIFSFYRRYKMQAPVTFKDTGIGQLIEQHRNQAIPSYPIQWDAREFVLGSDFTCPTHGLAAYHQSTLRLGDFTLTAGIRLDYEHSSLNYHSETHTGYRTIELATQSIYAHESIDIDDGGHLSRHFVQVLPKFSATYHINDLNNLFINVSKGYKAGGFNTQMFSDVLQQRLMRMLGIGAAYSVDEIVGYKPEVAWNFELGSAFSTTDKKLSGQANVFYLDCRDRQLTIFPDGTTTGRVMTNAGKTRSWGAEIRLAFTPWSHTTFNASYGYTNAKFVKYNDGKADYKGKFVPYSPEHTLWLEAQHAIDINRQSRWCRQLLLGANLSGAGRIYWDEANSLSQPFYALLGANVTLVAKDFTLQLWGTNLTGTRYSTFRFVSIGHEFLQQGRKRMLGATLRINL